MRWFVTGCPLAYRLNGFLVSKGVPVKRDSQIEEAAVDINKAVMKRCDGIWIHSSIVFWNKLCKIKVIYIISRLCKGQLVPWENWKIVAEFVSRRWTRNVTFSSSSAHWTHQCYLSKFRDRSRHVQTCKRIICIALSVLLIIVWRTCWDDKKTVGREGFLDKMAICNRTNWFIIC